MKAYSNETLTKIFETCSQSEQGGFLQSQCFSVVSFLDTETSEVYQCYGSHAVATKGTKTDKVELSAQCTFQFRPFAGRGDYEILDVTHSVLLPDAVPEGTLYPEALSWVVGGGRHQLAFCSRFLAGLAGMQSRCDTAEFDQR
jgi:hypothetical protein